MLKKITLTCCLLITLSVCQAQIPDKLYSTRVASNAKETSRQILQIIKPIDQATIFDNQGNVDVVGNVYPALQAHAHVLLILDGKKMTKPQQILIWQLKNIDRGTHQLQIQIEDGTGKILMHSNTVTFYLHRAIVH